MLHINIALLDAIPTPVAPGVPLPLSEEELINLYRTNGTVTRAEEREMAIGLPDPQQLASLTDVKHWMTESRRLLQENLTFRRDLWSPALDCSSVEVFEQLQYRLERALELLLDTSSSQGWCLTAIAAGRDGGLRHQVWDDLIT